MKSASGLGIVIQISSHVKTQLRTDQNIHAEIIFDGVKVFIVDGNDPADARKQLYMSILIQFCVRKEQISLQKQTSIRNDRFIFPTGILPQNPRRLRCSGFIPKYLNARHTPRSV